MLVTEFGGNGYNLNGIDITDNAVKDNIAWTTHESEGALMIIIHDALFGIVGIIFQLTEWIAIVAALQRSDKNRNDMLGFSYHEIPTRHEVPRVPYVHEIIMNEK